MNIYAITLLLVNTAALLMIRRRWAPLPILVGACYMLHGQTIHLGLFNVSVLRMLIAVGFVRTAVRGERIAGRMNSLDWLMLLWSAWMLISSLFHKDLSAVFMNRLGLAYDACGIYFLFRIFCQSLDDIIGLSRITVILLLPLAAEMLYEKMTNYNIFSELADNSIKLDIREGRIRAQGPFAHAILAGTIGAVCLPFIAALWRQYRKEAVMGIVACLIMIVTSASSGPILSAAAGIGALFMWRYRHLVRLARWIAIIGYVGLDLIMRDPAYFVLARIDLAGGSTGWHRARLIQSAIEHLSEWWLVGTDYTRHWMPTGVYWSEEHTDITSHYLLMGIIGGLLLMLLFISVLAKGFSFVGQALHQTPELSLRYQFLIWSLGSMLFAHAISITSVAYFDQSFMFLYLTLAAIGSVWSEMIIAKSSDISRQHLPGQPALNMSAL